MLQAKVINLNHFSQNILNFSLVDNFHLTTYQSIMEFSDKIGFHFFNDCWPTLTNKYYNLSIC